MESVKSFLTLSIAALFAVNSFAEQHAYDSARETEQIFNLAKQIETALNDDKSFTEDFANRRKTLVNSTAISLEKAGARSEEKSSSCTSTARVDDYGVVHAAINFASPREFSRNDDFTAEQIDEERECSRYVLTAKLPRLDLLEPLRLPSGVKDIIKGVGSVGNPTPTPTATATPTPTPTPTPTASPTPTATATPYPSLVSQWSCYPLRLSPQKPTGLQRIFPDAYFSMSSSDSDFSISAGNKLVDIGRGWGIADSFTLNVDKSNPGDFDARWGVGLTTQIVGFRISFACDFFTTD